MEDQVNGGPKLYGNITDSAKLAENYRMNCIPESIGDMGLDDYQDFLQERRALMAKKIRTYFESL
jgi:hypothetical protein